MSEPVIEIYSHKDGQTSDEEYPTISGRCIDGEGYPLDGNVMCYTEDKVITVGSLQPDGDGYFSVLVPLFGYKNVIEITSYEDGLGQSVSVSITLYYGEKPSPAPEISSVTISPNPANTRSTIKVVVEVS